MFMKKDANFSQEKLRRKYLKSNLIRNTHIKMSGNYMFLIELIYIVTEVQSNSRSASVQCVTLSECEVLLLELIHTWEVAPDTNV